MSTTTPEYTTIFNEDGTPRHTFYISSRPELVIELRDAKHKTTFSYNVRVGIKAIPLVDSWARIVDALCEKVHRTNNPTVRQQLIDSLPAFIRKFGITTRFIEVVDIRNLPPKKPMDGTIVVFGNAISVAQQQACFDVMVGRFNAAAVSAAAIRAGVHDPAIARRFANKLLQRERRAGKIKYVAPFWVRCQEQENAGGD